MDAVIQVESLTKRFGSLVAVDGVSFEVQRGEVFGILGPNGAGKTTTLECVEGLQKHDAGRVLVLGVDTRQETSKVKNHIGIQLQASAYFDYLTLLEILELFGGFYQRRVAPMDLLERVGLVEKARTTVNKLSGGQKQRFTIAASLVNDPEVLFLDEPTTGLDPQARRQIWDFVRSIHKEGRTVVLTTHYMEEAQFLCHRVAIMDHAKIVALDTPANLVHRLPVPYEVHLTCACALPEAELKGLAGVHGVGRENGTYKLQISEPTQVLPTLIDWAKANGIKLDHLEVVSATLEDVFLSITGRQLRD